MAENRDFSRCSPMQPATRFCMKTAEFQGAPNAGCAACMQPAWARGICPVFVQATTSNGFDSAKLGAFSFGVQDFFKDEPNLIRTDYGQEAHRMMDHIFKNSAKFRHGNPACRMFYVSTGIWKGEGDPEVRRQTGCHDLENTTLFSEVTFECVDRPRLQELAKRAQNSISRKFMFPKKSAIPCGESIKSAYTGFVPASTLMNIVTDEDGNIIRSVFYDNIRDFLGNNNKVNRGIEETLSSERRKNFGIMNNGVTIIAKELGTTGDDVDIEDFQVVNGCQTCHSLYNSRETLAYNDVFVPLKLIHTQDEEVISDILFATNKQTEVKESQFIGAQRFPKDLEAYFNTYKGDQALYFERRACQYESMMAHIQKNRVFPQKTVINAFASMFLREPHSTTRNHSRLIEKIGETIFNKDHKHIPYYTASYALFRVDNLIKNRNIGRVVERYHILLATKLLFDPHDLPRMSSHEIERYCNKFLTVLWDDENSEELITQAAEVVHSVIPKDDDSRDMIRTKEFTDSVITACGADFPDRRG